MATSGLFINPYSLPIIPASSTPSLLSACPGIRVMNSAGATQTNLAVDGRTYLPDWSPERKRILFTSRRDHSRNVIAPVSAYYSGSTCHCTLGRPYV